MKNMLERIKKRIIEPKVLYNKGVIRSKMFAIRPFEQKKIVKKGVLSRSPILSSQMPSRYDRRI